jgi:hypothetical protein
MDIEPTKEERMQMYLDLCDRIYRRLLAEGKWEEVISRLTEEEGSRGN